MKTIRAVLKWGALIAGSGMALLFVVMFVGESLSTGWGALAYLTTEETLEFMAVFVMIAGTLAAWRWPRAGATLMVVGGLAFNVFESAWSGYLRPVWFANVFIVAGLALVLAEIRREQYERA